MPGIVLAPVAVVDDLAHDVGQRLVDGAGLAPVEEVGVVRDHAVGHLVADDIVGRRIPLAVEHPDAVPERVRQRAVERRLERVAPAHRRGQAPVVALVDAQQVRQVQVPDPAVELRHDTGQGERVVDVLHLARGTVLGASEVLGARDVRRRHEVVAVADDPVDLLVQIEVPDDDAAAVVDEHEPVERRARVDLDPPDASCVGRRVGGPAHSEYGRVPQSVLRRVGRRAGCGPRPSCRAAVQRDPGRSLARVRRAGHGRPGHRGGHGRGWRSGCRSTATAPPITGSPLRTWEKRTTSSPVTARDTGPAARRVPGSATPTRAPYRLRWARAASRGEEEAVTAGLRAPEAPATRRNVGAAGHAHRAACVRGQTGQSTVAPGHNRSRALLSIGRAGRAHVRGEHRHGERQHGTQSCTPASHRSTPVRPGGWSARQSRHRGRCVGQERSRSPQAGRTGVVGEAGRLAQGIDPVGALPGELRELPAEVAVRRGLGVDRAQQFESSMMAAGRRSKTSSAAAWISSSGTTPVP